MSGPKSYSRNAKVTHEKWPFCEKKNPGGDPYLHFFRKIFLSDFFAENNFLGVIEVAEHDGSIVFLHVTPGKTWETGKKPHFPRSGKKREKFFEAFPAIYRKISKNIVKKIVNFS